MGAVHSVFADIANVGTVGTAFANPVAVFCNC